MVCLVQAIDKVPRSGRRVARPWKWPGQEREQAVPHMRPTTSELWKLRADKIRIRQGSNAKPLRRITQCIIHVQSLNQVNIQHQLMQQHPLADAQSEEEMRREPEN